MLSKHIKSLEEAGYVAVVKRRDFGHRRTWVSLTSAGRSAYTEHVKELKRIVESH
ncbi:MAG: transcriptional regulator [Planctomycetes bacterium]|nr:transcriptional regulator [Planctomycetota bacterium]